MSQFPNAMALRANAPYVTSQYRSSVTLGTVGRTEDDRYFRWSKAGAVALAPGKLMQSEVPGANFSAMTIPTAQAIGAKDITVTNGATAITANMFRDGYINFVTSTGAGALYRIASHPAADAAASCVITLENGLAAAIAATTTADLIKHKCDAVIIHPSPPTAAVIGVPLVAVTAAYYFWAQVHGPCSVLTDGTLVIGKLCMPSASVDGAAATYTTGGDDEIIVGQVMKVDADQTYSIVDLDLP